MSWGANTNVALPQNGSKAVETGLLRGGYEAEGTRCSPIGLEQAGQIPAPPEGAAQQGEKTSEAVLPAMHESQETQEDIDQQGPPDLPAQGVGAVTRKIGGLKGLLDLLEEGFDGPAVAVKISDT